MSDYLNEDEQVQAIKDWWKKYGTTAVVAIIMGVTGLFSYQYWQSNKVANKGQASTIYQALLNDNEKNDRELQLKQASYLKLHYPNTIYASMASLFLAKQAIANNDMPTAEIELAYAVKHADSDIFKDLINLRRARVLVALEKSADALDVLDKIKLDHLDAAKENIKGDILISKGDIKGAKAAYEKALQANYKVPVLDALINLKLTTIAE